MPKTPFDETLSKIRWLVSQQTKIEIESVRPESRLLQDLGIDSLEIVELLMNVEEEFDISFDDKESQEMFTIGL